MNQSYLRWSLSCLLLALFTNQSATAIEDDKLTHFAASAAISYLGMAGLCQLGLYTPRVEIGGFVIGFGAGLIKESSDDKTDSGDLIANGIGSAAGVGLGNLTLGCSRGSRSRRSTAPDEDGSEKVRGSLAHLR